MNTVYIHIDETLDSTRMRDLKSDLMTVPYVTNVELNPGTPHDILVEFEEHHNVPMVILGKLSGHGLHSDIMSC